MGMLGPAIYTQVFHLGPAKRSLGNHALNGFFNDTLGKAPVENLTDDSGRSAPSGLYVARLESGGVMTTQKLVLVR